MTTSELAEFREIIDRCLAGVEQSPAAASRFRALMTLLFEANYQASRTGEPPLPEYPDLDRLSAIEKRRFTALMEAAFLDSTPALEWLPPDQDGAA